MTALVLMLALGGSASAKKPGALDDWVHTIALPGSRPAAVTDEPYKTCFHVAGARGRKERTIETSAASVDLSCERVDRRTDKVCLTVAPGVWPRLPFEGSCPMGRREIRVAFYAGHPARLEEGDELVLRVMNYQPGDPTMSTLQARWQCVELYDAHWREGPVQCVQGGGAPMRTTRYGDGNLSMHDGGWQLCMMAIGEVATHGMDSTKSAEVGTCMLPTDEGDLALPTRVESVSPTWE